jgi:hypothetical protein
LTLSRLAAPPPATDQRGAGTAVDGDNNSIIWCDAGAVEYGAASSVVYFHCAQVDSKEVGTALADASKTDDSYQWEETTLCHSPWIVC